MHTRILPVALLCLVGCYRFHDAPLSPEMCLDNFNRRSLASKETASWMGAAAPGSQGWNLDQLTRASFLYNPELREMRANLREAQGASATAAERPNPVVGVRPGYNTTTPSSADISPWIFDLTIDLPIETMGKRSARMAQAGFREEAARMAVASAAWDVRDRIRAAMLKLYATRADAEFLQERRDLLREKAEQMERRLAAGDASAAELHAIAIECGIADNELAENQRLKQEALAQMATAIGVPPASLEDIRFDSAGFDVPSAPPPGPEARRMALLNRADLLAALAEYNAAQMALKEEVAKQYPDLLIGPGYTFDQSEDKWSLGVSLSLPLFNRNQGAIKAAEARREALAAAFLKRQDAVAAEIESAVRDTESYRERMAACTKIEQQSEAQADTVRRMVDLGELSVADALQSRFELVSARQALLQARVEAIDALGRLEHAMQHPAAMPDCPPPNGGESL